MTEENLPPDSSENPYESPETPSSPDEVSTSGSEKRGPIFGKNAFWILAVPYIVFLAGNSIGDYLDKARTAPHDEDIAHLPPEEKAALEKKIAETEKWYPISYTIVISITTLLVLAVGRGYFKHPLKVNLGLSVGVGVVGIVVWLALWWLWGQISPYIMSEKVGNYVSRSAFDPFSEMSENPSWMYAFIAIRFFGLVIIVPIIEEFFLRGFLMRYIDDPDWDEIPIGIAGKGALIGILVYAIASHPAEPLAAVAWFGLVTWMYLRTKSIWDCVIAHAVTNLLLGIYVLATKTWELW